MRIRRVPLALVALGIACATMGAQEKPRPVLTLPLAEQEALGVMLQEVLAMLPDSSATACVVLRGGPPRFWYNPDSTLLKSLRSPSGRY